MSAEAAQPTMESDDSRTLAGRIGRGAAWSAGSTLLMRFTGIAVMAVVARVMTPQDFGIFAVAITVHAVVSSIGELGVTSCLVRGDFDPDEIAPTIATISMVSSVVLAGCMYAFATPLATLLGSSQGAAPMRVLSLTVLLVGVFAVPSAQLVRDFRQDRQFLATVAGFIPSNALLLFLAVSGGGAMAFAWSRVVGQLVTGLVIMASVSHNYRPGFAPKRVRHLLMLGLPLAGANLMNYTLLNADFALIGRLLGPVELGAYMLAFNVASWSTALLGAMINGVAMPAFARVRHDRSRFADAIATSLTGVSAVAFPVAAMTMVLASPLISTIYGAKWSASAPVLACLSVYGAVAILCLLLSNLLVAVERTRALFVVQLAWLAALVPSLTYSVNRWGILGAGVAHVLVAIFLILPAYLYLLRSRVGLALPVVLRSTAGPFWASVLAGTAAWFAMLPFEAPPLRLLVGATVGALAYVAGFAPQFQRLIGDRELPMGLHRPLGSYAGAVRRVLGGAAG